MHVRRTNMLSEKNLRLHTAGFPKNNASVPIDPIREERAWPAKQDAHRPLIVDIDSLEDTDFSPQDGTLEARREASLDALKLYSGSFASLCTPLDRFIGSSPTNDVQPWLARHSSNDSAIGLGHYWETLDASKTASEMNVNIESEEVKEICPGSPRPSSDTLSVSRDLESCTRKDRKDHNGPRNRRKLRMRRRHNVEQKMKASRSPRPSGE